MDVIGPGIVLKRFERKPNMLCYATQRKRYVKLGVYIEGKWLQKRKIRSNIYVRVR